MLPGWCSGPQGSGFSHIFPGLNLRAVAIAYILTYGQERPQITARLLLFLPPTARVRDFRSRLKGVDGRRSLICGTHKPRAIVGTLVAVIGHGLNFLSGR